MTNPQAITGVVLRRANRTGIWTINGPGRTEQTFGSEVELCDIAPAAQPALGSGYWLRAMDEIVSREGRVVNVAQRWTWVRI